MRFLTLCLCLTIAPQLLIAAEVANLAEIHGKTMGTSYSVKWTPESDVTPDAIQQLVDERLEHINALMSTYDPQSELSLFNTSDSTDWYSVSPETAKVVSRSLQIAQESEGAFDPTVGRLVRLWSFGPGGRDYSPPPQSEIEAALKSVGYQHVQVRLESPAIKKDSPEVELDLSAIAKGFAVDDISQLLAEQGLENTLVEIGGEVVARGAKPDGPWTLGVERPEPVRSAITARVELQNQALATSGDYRNYFEKDGVKYSHTIDPHTGHPVSHQLASASVLADDCMTADALATTMMVMGPERAMQFAANSNLAVYLLVRDGAGFDALVSDAARQRFQSDPTLAKNAAPAAKGGNFLQTFLLTAAVFGVAIACLAVGVIFSNRALKGSCGGLNGLKDEQGRSICDMCTTPPEECDQVRQAAAHAVGKPPSSEV